MTSDFAARARDWHHATHAAVCDVIDPWAHGTVVRATRYPSYYDYNVVRVEEDLELDVDDLAAFADEALAGLEHRRVDFDVIDAAEQRRPGFEALGWKSLRLVWMRHEAPLAPRPELRVEEVPYDDVHHLRVSWHQEEMPGIDPSDYLVSAREVAMRRNAIVLAVVEDGTPTAYAQLERNGAAAEITQVYVHPARRGGGRGTAMTRAAIESGGDLEDLWICADDEDRAKDLYARLGFRPVWKSMEFVRLP